MLGRCRNDVLEKGGGREGFGGGGGGGRFLRGIMAYIILPESAVLVLHVSPVPILYESPLAVSGGQHLPNPIGKTSLLVLPASPPCQSSPPVLPLALPFSPTVNALFSQGLPRFCLVLPIYVSSQSLKADLSCDICVRDAARQHYTIGCHI